jgi:hypothetical protein
MGTTELRAIPLALLWGYLHDNRDPGIRWIVTAQHSVAPEFQTHRRLLADKIQDNGCFLNELLCRSGDRFRLILSELSVVCGSFWAGSALSGDAVYCGWAYRD